MAKFLDKRRRMKNINMISSRNKAHASILFIVYDSLLYDKFQVEYDIKELITDIVGAENYEDVDAFVKEVVIKTLLHEEELIKEIEPHLVKWTFNRLPLLTQAILLSSLAKRKYISNIDRNVIIDVAINLAKKYLKDNDYRFVNAILDNIL